MHTELDFLEDEWETRYNELKQYVDTQLLPFKDQLADTYNEVGHVAEAKWLDAHNMFKNTMKKIRKQMCDVIPDEEEAVGNVSEANDESTTTTTGAD